MLTIKLIRQDGSEFIEEAKSFAYNAAKQSASGYPSITYFTKINELDVIAHDIYDGKVYVMNDYGKTIGDYFLGWPDEENDSEKSKLQTLIEVKKIVIENNGDLSEINKQIKTQEDKISKLKSM